MDEEIDWTSYLKARDKEYKERTDWLNSLEIGSEVARNLGRGRQDNYEIAKVSRATKTQLDAFNWTYSRGDGQKRGRTSWDMGTRIEPVTQDIRDSVEKASAVYRISTFSFQSLSLECLREVLSIIEAREERAGE